MLSAPEPLSRNELKKQAERFNGGNSVHNNVLADWTAAIDAVKAGDEPARAVLCAGLLSAAFRHPGSIDALVDGLAEAWLGKPCDVDPVFATEPLPDLGNTRFTTQFWEALWLLLDDSSNLDALNLTARVAALGGTLDPTFGELAEQRSRRHPGAAEPQRRTPPAVISLATLAQAPAGSLAQELHSMLVDNGYDAEVLDRQALGLGQLPPGLRYLNTRILQMHDVWHLSAGYQTTSLHEIAISAFQLAQFGHNYSAMFLAVVVTVACTTRPEGLPILLQIISEAWRHGRSTPSFMAIDWEEEWYKPIGDIRAERGIRPFSSKLPANLFETLAQANTA